MTGTFLDTNVLVYAVDRGEPVKRARAIELLAAARGDQLVLSTQVLLEFYVVVTRKLARPLTEEQAAARVAELAKLRVVGTDPGLVQAGIAVSRTAQLSPSDGMIVAAARAAGCERILTEDLSDGSSIGGVLIENPFAARA